VKFVGAPDTKRIQHDPTQLPTTARGKTAEDHVNDLFEEADGLGFAEAIYRAPPQQVFIDKIVLYETSAKVKKRSEFVFDYGTSFPFIETITKTVFNKEGTAGVATVIATFVLKANKTIDTIDTGATRP